jgi:16S rRNA processing protein RimM
LEHTAAIGKVINTHGVKGALKVMPLSDFPERLKTLDRVFVEKEGLSTPRKVDEAFVHGRFWIVRLEGIATYEEARTLVGSVLTILLSERMELPEGSYYLDQIIGLEVYTVGGDYLGFIRDVLQTGGNDVYIVSDKDKGTEVLIPALKTVVVAIDLEGRKMEVDPPEGLL